MGHTKSILSAQPGLGGLYHAWLCSRPFWFHLPLVGLLLAWAGPRGGIGLAAGLFVLGLAAWTVVEWVLHWLMHVPTRRRWFRAVQEIHLRHHREPDNLPGSVLSLRGSIPLSAMFFGLALLLFQSVVPAVLFHAGLTTGYLCYEFIHLACHARWQIPGLAALQRYHGLHHSRHWNRHFGVTSPLWDYAFGKGPR
jgi:hypothetical protein